MIRCSKKIPTPNAKKVFDVAGIEYGRADFGIYRGRVQVYEINTNPHVAPASDHPSTTRIASLKLSWEKYLAGLRVIDSNGGGLVRLGNETPSSHCAHWKNLAACAKRRKSAAMKLSLIISAYNQRASLEKIFRAISLQSSRPDEILIADDGSSDGTDELIEQWRNRAPAPVQHLWHPDEGFLKTTILNKTVAAAVGDYLVFLDGDCVPHAKFIVDHRALAERGCWVQGRRCFVREQFVPEFIPGKTSPILWAIQGRIHRRFKSIRLPFPIVRRDRGQRGILGFAIWPFGGRTSSR